MVGMRRRALGVLLVVSCIAAVMSVPTPGSAQELIQPGALMVAPHGCTLNFMFRGAGPEGARYIGTAGHCVDRVGQRVGMAGGEIGTVAFVINHDRDDFALIQVDEELWEHMSPEVRGIGGPAGFTTATATSAGDPVALYGHGMVLSSSEATRPRSGVLTVDDAQEWHAAMPTIFGDSGGPVLHVPTGKAMGVVSGVWISTDHTRPHTVKGTTIERALELLDEAGLAAELVTA